MPASDLYGLGATLVHLLTGKSPTELVAYDGSLRLPEHPVLGGWFGRWLVRMVAPDPQHRFLDAGFARAAIERQEAGVAILPQPLSRLGCFLALEASEVRTRVKLPVPWRSNDQSAMLNVTAGAWFFNSMWPLGLALIGFSIARRSYWVQIELDGGNCRLHRGCGPLTLQRRSFPLSSDSLMLFERLAVPKVVGDRPRTKLGVQLGTEKFEFTTHLDDEEAQWLISRFEAHRDRFCARPITVQVNR